MRHLPEEYQSSHLMKRIMAFPANRLDAIPSSPKIVQLPLLLKNPWHRLFRGSRP
jgi:hypothetical protein